MITYHVISMACNWINSQKIKRQIGAKLHPAKTWASEQYHHWHSRIQIHSKIPKSPVFVATSLHVTSYKSTMWTDTASWNPTFTTTKDRPSIPPTRLYYHAEDGPTNGSNVKCPPSAKIIGGWGDRSGVGRGTLLTKIPCPERRKFDVTSNAK